LTADVYGVVVAFADSIWILKEGRIPAN